jgi:hypothetical protein
MQLFVLCHQNNHRFVFAYPARVRADLPDHLELVCPFDQDTDWYYPNEVQASAGNAAVPGAVIGGLIGIVGGPLGMILGGMIGGGLGAKAQQEDQERANAFNES